MPKLFRSNIITLLIAMIIGTELFSQDIQKDFALIRENGEEVISAARKPDFMLPQTQNPFVKYNPINLVFGSSMYFYQKFLSQQFHAQCLYHPSCSEFSKQLISTHGLFLGIVYSSDRLMRCNRIAAMDIPPIKVDRKTHKVNESPFIYDKNNKE